MHVGLLSWKQQSALSKYNWSSGSLCRALQMTAQSLVMSPDDNSHQQRGCPRGSVPTAWGRGRQEGGPLTHTPWPGSSQQRGCAWATTPA